MEPDAPRQILKQLTEALDECSAEHYKAWRAARALILRHMETGEPIRVGLLVWKEMLRRKRDYVPPAA